MDLLQVYRKVESLTLPKEFYLWETYPSWDRILQGYREQGDEVVFDIQEDYCYVLVNDSRRITIVVLAALPGSEIKATLRCLGAIKKLMRESSVKTFSAVCRTTTSWPLIQAMEKKGKIKLIHHFTENIGEEVEVVAGIACF